MSFLLRHIPEVCEQVIIGLKHFIKSVRVKVS